MPSESEKQGSGSNCCGNRNIGVGRVRVSLLLLPQKNCSILLDTRTLGEQDHVEVFAV
jgi:hypothetical protein